MPEASSDEAAPMPTILAMGASASVTKVAERANELATQVLDFAQDAQDVFVDATRVKRDDEIEAVLQSGAVALLDYDLAMERLT